MLLHASQRYKRLKIKNGQNDRSENSSVKSLYAHYKTKRLNCVKHVSVSIIRLEKSLYNLKFPTFCLCVRLVEMYFGNSPDDHFQMLGIRVIWYAIYATVGQFHYFISNITFVSILTQNRIV